MMRGDIWYLIVAYCDALSASNVRAVSVGLRQACEYSLGKFSRMTLMRLAATSSAAHLIPVTWKHRMVVCYRWRRYVRIENRQYPAAFSVNYVDAQRVSNWYSDERMLDAQMIATTLVYINASDRRCRMKRLHDVAGPALVCAQTCCKLANACVSRDDRYDSTTSNTMFAVLGDDGVCRAFDVLGHIHGTTMATGVVDVISGNGMVVSVSAGGSVSLHGRIGTAPHTIRAITAELPPNCLWPQTVIPVGAFFCIYTTAGWVGALCFKDSLGVWQQAIRPPPPLPHPSTIVHSSGCSNLTGALVYVTTCAPTRVMVWDREIGRTLQVQRRGRPKIITGLTDSCITYIDGHIIALEWSFDRVLVVRTLGAVQGGSALAPPTPNITHVVSNVANEKCLGAGSEQTQ